MLTFSDKAFNPQPEPPRPGGLTAGANTPVLPVLPVGLLLPAVQK